MPATTTTEKPENSDDKKKEIPFTFSVPKTSDDLEELFSGRGPKEKAIIVERMIKCNHPQFGKDNKAQLENLFAFLLQHIHDCASIGKFFDLIAHRVITTNEILLRISALASKKRSNQKLKALYYTNYGLFNIIGIKKFLIQPLFRG